MYRVICLLITMYVAISSAACHSKVGHCRTLLPEWCCPTGRLYASACPKECWKCVVIPRPVRLPPKLDCRCNSTGLFTQGCQSRSNAFDLSSSALTSIAPNNVVVIIGGVPVAIRAGKLITAGMYLSVIQSLNGSQTLTVNLIGQAISGSFRLIDVPISRCNGTFVVIPRGIVVITGLTSIVTTNTTCATICPTFS
jgi:hypothetical protein